MIYLKLNHGKKIFTKVRVISCIKIYNFGGAKNDKIFKLMNGGNLLTTSITINISNFVTLTRGNCIGQYDLK
jgi:hypothetical protein